ncbi:MAG: hypothetical protein IJE02_04140 [Clostridia bacterium]|nr:hypothetical protein [Clostridia bacterium]
MSKIHAFITIPVMELTEIVAKCGAVVGAASQLISKYYTEPTKKEASQEPKAEASVEPQKEASSEEEILPGVVIKKHPTEPFEMVIE